jgi:hypothetical protein
MFFTRIEKSENKSLAYFHVVPHDLVFTLCLRGTIILKNSKIKTLKKNLQPNPEKSHCLCTASDGKSK